MSDKKTLVRVDRLSKYFPVGGTGKKRRYVQAVEDVSISIYKGETLGIVGESGCGKTTFGRSILRLTEPTRGRVCFDGDIIYNSGGLSLPKLDDQGEALYAEDGSPLMEESKFFAPKMLPYRSKMQIIFQDPSASLDPRMTVGEIVGEALTVHRPDLKKRAYTDRIHELLEIVGLNSEHANRFPHEFSGGQQQRVGIARALAVEPDFIVCDEPVSALDVSIQSQIVNTLEDLQAEMGLTYLFIAHDISVVRHISDRIGVMYLGKVVELAQSYELYSKPLHPYSQTLLSAVPIPDPEKTRARERILLEGDIPSPINPPPGCRFHSRCPYAMEKCREVTPEMKEHAPQHYAACHLLG